MQPEQEGPSLTPTIDNAPCTPTSSSGNPTFRSLDTATPKTNDPALPIPPSLEPPRPPRIRIKRRRPGFASYQVPQVSQPQDSDPLPSIELSESSHTHPSLEHEPECQQDLLGPTALRPASSVSPPRTPTTQISAGPGDATLQNPWFDSARAKIAASITRPSSAWSEVSESSASTASSSDTFPSFGESCTSPESDAQDPFFPESKSTLIPPAMQATSHTSRKRQKKEPRTKWTSEMDKHLWLTYMAYLADPTVTPFKTLPGTTPPLGVCHRVARQAKKTWKGSRSLLNTVAEDEPAVFGGLDPNVVRRETSAPPTAASSCSPMDIFQPDPPPRSSSSASNKLTSRWPKSASSTRRRLRELCKRKPALSPHYQRLMQTRTPSPFESSSRHQRSSSARSSAPSSSFETRDLNFTLATSTAASMQPGAPLSQLTSEGTLDEGPYSPTTKKSSAHQKSRSLQLNLGLDKARDASPRTRRLASPFVPHPKPEPSITTADLPAQGPLPLPKLDSPLELHHPRPLSGSMKRRAQYQLGEELFSDDPDVRQNYLEYLFRDQGGIGNGKRRVRSRGFSLGSMHGSAPSSRHISELFHPPPPHENAVQDDLGEDAGRGPLPGVAEVPALQALAPPQQTQQLPPPHLDTTRRLGSPFAPAQANVGFSNTFPRSLFPQGLDSISSLEQGRRGNGEAAVGSHGGGDAGALAASLDDPFVSNAPS